MHRTRPHSFWLAAALSALVALAPTAARAQTVNKAIEKDSTGNLTASFATGNKTLTVASGGTLTAAAGSTVTLAGTVGGTPTGGTLNLAGLTLALGTPASGNLTNATALNATQLTSGTVPAARLPAFTGDITTTAGTVATTLATVNSNVGTFGSATAAPAITVNGKGLVTAVSNTTITPAVGSITGLGTGVAALLAGTASGTGGIAGTASPTFTGTFSAAGISATGNITTSSTTASTNTTTGSIQSAGGMGVAGRGNFGDYVTITTASAQAGLSIGATQANQASIYLRATNVGSVDWRWYRDSSNALNWEFNGSGLLSLSSAGVFNVPATTSATTSTVGALTIGNGTAATNVAIGGGIVNIGGRLITATSTPASASASGTAGTITWDSSYVYVCVATNTWKRVAIATW